MTAHVALDVIIDAPVDRVFAAFSQWEQQGLWMLGTRVEVRVGDGHSVGSELAAWSGAGPLGFWDTMTITRWEPPYRVDVDHTGAVVRGTGTMEVIALPMGALGRAGWPLAKPAFLAGVRRSLQQFGRLVEAGTLPV